MHIVVSLSGNGFHPAAWRFADAPAFPIGRHVRDMTLLAERGRLDAVLLDEPAGGAALRASGRVNGLRIDALPLLGSLIAETRRIGLAASWAVDFAEPYNVARVFATLDHLAGGRTAWIVGLFGGADLAPNFRHARGVVEGDAYCRRAVEFIDLTRKLWDSWEDGGFLLDVPSGRFADPERVHPVHHAGEFFTVRGPLNVPRPPQGNPPTIQHDAGTEDGRRLAATTADVLLTHCATPDASGTLYRAFRNAVAAGGRNPDDVRLLANLTPVLAASEPEARRLADELDHALPPGLTAETCDPRAGLRFVGTPEECAALMEAWVTGGCCDGFNIRPAIAPRDLARFVEGVVPLLRARGLFRRDYDGATLRDHLGLAHSDSRYAA